MTGSRWNIRADTRKKAHHALCLFSGSSSGGRFVGRPNIGLGRFVKACGFEARYASHNG